MTPDENTRMGRMLAAGSVTITTTSISTGKHLTVRIDCCRRGQRWERVPYAEASHLFVNEEPQGTRIATFYPKTGEWRDARGFVDPALTWAGTNALKAALGLDASAQARYQESNQCGRCRRDLTDPVSIERGIGPECYAKATGSTRAEVRREARESWPEPSVGKGIEAPDGAIGNDRSPGEREFGDWLEKEFAG